MKPSARIDKIIEAANSLPLEEQETLVGILNRRMIDRRRSQLASEIAEASEEFRRGECRPAEPDELMREIQF
jgi:hypothetical protein